MHRNAGGLIDCYQRIIFINNGKFNGWDIFLLRLFGDTNRWNSHLIAHFQAIGLIYPFFVHPDLATAQNTVNMAFWHPFKGFTQKVVYSLIAATLVYFSPVDRFFA